jgi:hypothetical protein
MRHATVTGCDDPNYIRSLSPNPPETSVDRGAIARQAQQKRNARDVAWYRDERHRYIHTGRGR